MVVWFRRLAALSCAAALMLSGGALPSFSAAAEEEGADAAWYKEGTYAAYLQDHRDAGRPEADLRIPAADYQEGTAQGISSAQGLPQTEEAPVALEEGSSVTWTVTVEQAGLYAVGFSYYPLAGKDVTIERELLVNGRLPFEGSASILFSRRWAYVGEVGQDSTGNDVRPEQEETPDWFYTLAGGIQDYVDEPYLYYFQAGENTLTLQGGKEPLALAWLELTQPDSPPSYADYLAAWEAAGAARVTGDPLKIQGEAAVSRSDRTISLQNDRTSPITEPMIPGEYPVTQLKLNSIGGQNWQYQKQWIEWEVVTEQAGLYRLGLRFKQSYLEGTYATRRLLVNGEVPFAEADCINFSYDFNWQSMVVGEDGGWYIYLNEGRNTLRLENTIGEISEIIQTLQGTVSELNTVYRRILMITGSQPDPNRDYNLDKELPECMAVFEEQREVLMSLAGRLDDMTGSKGTAYAQLQKAAIQLESFLEDPDSIPERMETFRSNISDLASWMLSVTEQPLLLDYLLIMTEGAEAPASDASFWGKLWFELENFFYSFFMDYNAIGEEQGEMETIELWMGTSGLTGAAQTAVAGASGRDQAQILKSMIGDTFTPQKQIQVNIRLVDMSVLLPAVASGNGPDVAINQEQTNPVNYALRDALYDLSSFPDYQEVLERFAPSAAAPFWLEDRLYALPETQVFSMLFYRTDILEELGLEPPETWGELTSALTVLGRSHLEIGLPNLSDNNLDVFYMLLYQYGGSVYAPEKDRTALGSEAAIEAFTDWSELYTKYNVQQKMDALTRFRTGETPLMIASFTFFNTLSASAPEIKGLWDIAPLPGTQGEEGFSRAAVSASTGAVIFQNSRNPEAAWEFLKWWTSADTQLTYGQEMEILMGEAARWPTANQEAFENLAWDRETMDSILEQKAQVEGLPELPGSYMTNRYVATAIRLVINNGLSPREAILDYSQKIDEEIRRKRQEFGMG